MLQFVFILTTQAYIRANYVPGIVLSSLQISYLILVTTSWERYYFYPCFVFIYSLLSIWVSYPETIDVTIPSLSKRKLVAFSTSVFMAKKSNLSFWLETWMLWNTTSLSKHLLSTYQLTAWWRKRHIPKTNKLLGPMTSTLESKMQYSAGSNRK